MKHFESAFEEFRKETIVTNASWRILRIDTLIDLTLLELYKYLKTSDEKIISKIIQYTIMIKYNLEYGILNVEDYFKLGMSTTEIESINTKLKAISIKTENEVSLTKSTALFNEYNYLRQLKNYDYHNVIIDTMNSILKELTQKNQNE